MAMRRLAPYTNRGVNFYKHIFPFLCGYIPTGHNILEIGCGEGNVIKYFARNNDATCINNQKYGVGNWRVSQLNTDVVTNFTRIRVLDVDYHQGLPFSKDTFDYIYSIHSFNEGKMQPSKVRYVLREVSRILKPNGTASIHLFSEYGVQNGLLRAIDYDKHFGLVWGGNNEITLQMVPHNRHQEWRRRYSKEYWTSLA